LVCGLVSDSVLIGISLEKKNRSIYKKRIAVIIEGIIAFSTLAV